MPNQPTTQMNTLRLGQHELTKLLEQFDKDQPENSNPDREFVRWSYRVGVVELVLEHSSGSKVTLPVATRNISRGGISILHAAYVHSGSSCDIILKIPGGKQQVISGKVVRCNHVEGRVHEVGIAFNQQISTKDLLGLDPLNEAYSLERVTPEHLHGSVLIVTASEMDRELMLKFLDETNLNMSTAEDIETAISRAKKGCDIIVSDYHIGNETGAQLIEALREAGADMPVIIMTADKTESVLDSIRDAEAAGILSKPVSADRVLQALAEFLHADGDGGPLYSTLNPEEPAYSLLGKFLVEITRIALNLEKSLSQDDPLAAIQICRTLSGTASPLGFPTISELAIDAEKKLSTADIKAASTELRSLIIACRRIKSKPAA